MASCFSEIGNPYKVLGVAANCTHEEVKRAYQKLVLKFHPDKLDDSLTEGDRDKAKEMFLAIDKAWKLLSDNERRENCDRQLKEQSLSQDWPVSAEVDLDDMEFHEDLQSYSSQCRCSGEYLITESDLENGHNIVCCSDCTLSVRVLYSVLQDDVNGEDQKSSALENS
ncbi:DnaJ subfamily C member 24 [Porites harrisoni]